MTAPSRTGPCPTDACPGQALVDASSPTAVAAGRPCCLYDAYVKVFDNVAQALRVGDDEHLREIRDDIGALTGREGLIARIALLDAERNVRRRDDDAFCALLCSDDCEARRG